MKKNAARKVYKRAPAAPVRNNLIMFPGVIRPAALSPFAEFEETGKLDLHKIVTAGRDVFAHIIGDVLEIRDDDDWVLWSIVPGEVTQ